MASLKKLTEKNWTLGAQWAEWWTANRETVEFPKAPEAKPKEGTAEDCPEPTDVDLFVDGGVFDNNPLGIAYRTARAGLEQRGPEVVLRKKPDGGRPAELDVRRMSAPIGVSLSSPEGCASQFLRAHPE